MPKAKGVDFSSKNKLKALAEQGYTAEEISSMIQVDENCVKSWVKYFGLDSEREVETEAKEEEED